VCEYRGVVAAAIISFEPNAAVAPAPQPQILRHGWIILGEFVVSLTSGDFD